MDAKLRRQIEQFVKRNIGAFHDKRVEHLGKIGLDNLLRKKNPYLFRAKNLNTANDLIVALLEARLSSSEEGAFGSFLEELAIFVAQISGNGQKSPAKGIDIDLERKKIRYLIAVKSGRAWGNVQSQREQKQNFIDAVRTIRQSNLLWRLERRPVRKWVRCGWEFAEED